MFERSLSIEHSTNKLPRDILAGAWAIALGAIAPMLDSTMINIAINHLIKDFHSSLNIIQWAITGYMLALAMAVPVSGWLMNRFNSKAVFINATVIFGIISLIIGISTNVYLFIALRLIQGFSAGVITTLMMSLLVKVAGQDKIGRVMAIVSTPMIFGPVLGGFLTQFLSWRWIFFINIFVVIIAVPLMNKYIPKFTPFNKEKKLDVAGMIMLIVFSGSFMYGINQFSQSSSHMSANIFIVIGIASLILYIFYDKRRHSETILPLSLFKYKSFSLSGRGLLLANAAIMGPMIILPLLFINIYHMNMIQASLALIPQGLGMLVTRPLIGKLIDSKGAEIVSLVSILISIISTIPFIFITGHTSIWWLYLMLFIRGCSVGGIMLGFTSSAYIGLEDKDLPPAGVAINMIENLGSSFGTAMIATIAAFFMTSKVPSMAQELSGYQGGFALSAVLLFFLLIPSLKLKSHSQNN
ncbi:MFS transporter [Staphylococcus carnosus]|uniref:Quinolone resistance protein NorB n=2 Tax=Staphylococcus carnosus TaxID=1281 RepID=A0AAJ0JNT1_STACA|nr:major facilitator transporter [Staphylococcus carnosus]PNZ96794.1 MFS transporter [Staphylococcus carnosus]UTB83384.1 MFS transporter [Staphylococcus carnosus]UTB99965.1 MFS transporter [Staphylococcus carnosus]UTC03244.1 MFS transporter [Staphylococcus carnosus]